MTDLMIGRKLGLPLDIITEALAILARRGRGKTYTASVLAEEMLEHHVQTVVADPTGGWYGLREGYPVIIMGGEHGDVPLEPSAGGVVADFIVEEGFSVVLDMSLFESRADEIRFMTAFCERLYRAKKKGTGVLHLFIDEASVFAPQNVRGDTARMVGAVEAIVRRGRIKGLGCTLIDQRPASVNKNVLTQAKGLIVLGVSAPTDRKAIMEWVQARGADLSKEMIDSLPSMEVGDAWVWLPDLDIFERIKIRKRRTFDSSATPKPGEKVRQPKEWSQVDLAAVQSRMADTIERAKADDPKELKKQIRELQGTVRKLESKAPESREVEVPVEVPVPLLEPGDVDRLEDVLRKIEKVGAEVIDETKVLMAAADSFSSHLEKVTSERTEPRRVSRPPATPQPRAPRSVPSSAPVADTEADTSKVGKSHRKVLGVLAQFPDGRTISQLALLSGYRISGGFRNILATLRTAGFMVGPNIGTMQITQEGLDFLDGDYEELPTGQSLVDYWIAKLPEGDGRTLRALLDHGELTIDELAEAAGYQVSGGFRNILSRLRTLNLIEGRNTETMRVHPDFLEMLS